MVETSIVLSMYNRDQTSIKVVEDLLIPGLINNRGKDKEIIIFDDYSPEIAKTQIMLSRNLPLLEDAFDKVEIIERKKERGGYSGSYNQAVRSAKGEILLMLSSDVYLPKGSVDNLTGKAILHDSMVGPVSNSAYGFQGTRHFDDMLGGKYIPDFSAENLRKLEYISELMDMNMPDNLYSAKRLSRLAFAIPRKAFIGAGGFDERLRNFWSDTDLSMKMKGRSYIDAKTFVYHHDKESLSNRPFTKGDIKTLGEFAMDTLVYALTEKRLLKTFEFIPSAKRYFFSGKSTITKEIKKYIK